MRISLLGPVRATATATATATDATPVDVGGVRLRMLLARLALEGGRPVSVDALVDGLWGEQPPADAGNALQALVSRLRKALRGTGTVDSVAGGYRIAVDADAVDTYRFEELAGQGRRELAAGRADEAASTLGDALALWRGAALADVLDAPFARPAAARLDDLWAAATEDRFDAELRLGRYADVLADLEAAGAERPLSERIAALRMRALSAAGRMADALAVYEEMRGRLDDELGVDPSAALKEVHLAVLRGELEQPEARPESAPTPNRLPARLTSFVGRDEELDRLDALLTASRLVTLVGPGGAGKTRLSLEAVTRHRAYRRGRVWFVPLAGVGTPDQLADAVHAALSAGLPASGARGDRVTEVLDVGEAVLVLDNCEHLVDAAADLAYELLDRLPHLRILATSREPLAITGEALCHIGPLGVPEGTPELAEAAGSAAVRLFVDRAHGVRPGFVLDESTLDAVVEICRRLDGLPLALELAAAKLRSMGVGQIARRLDDRFRLLTSGSRTALPRQRTLLAVVEWSWDLLDEPERILTRRLSMFPGGATVAALEAVCSDETLPAEDVVYVLGALVEKSLVEMAGGPDGREDLDELDGEQRYRMSETVRAFAAGRLAEAEARGGGGGGDCGGGSGGGGARTVERFSSYYLALAEEHEPALRTGDQLRSLALFDAEHDNLVSALRAAVEAGDAVVASRFVRALFWYWGIRGMSTQFETFLAEVLTFGEALPGPARAAFRVVRLMAGTPGATAGDDTPVRTLIEDCERADAGEFHPALLLWIPLLAFFTGNTDLGESGLRRAAERPEPWVRACAHWARDFVLTGRGEQRAGAASRRAALHGFEEVGDRWGLGLALLAVGGDHSLRGEHAEAIAAYTRAVTAGTELGAEDDLFNSRARLAAERLRGGDREGALRDIRAAQRQAKERGYRRMEAEMLFGLADLHRRSGEPDEAGLVLDRLDAAADRLTLPEAMARDLIAGARMANRLARGDAAGARELLPRAVGGAFARGEVADIAQAAELLARLRLLEDDAAGAATALGTSEAVRGVFDAGDPQLRELVAELVERLGEAAYEEAYGKGAGLPRADALNRLTEAAGQPVA
ncbi:BTAD domain-containing putative transcriptional regulator [Streptomyces sp. NPDC057302]|uniref:BTAD domain-containing putative transcriptional regulator n=1 Tax=Streptomyces sp. NPDC057302 TaxID=3346094 RepID=UPI0036391C7F